MAIIKKFTSYQNLSNYNTLVTDTNPNSDYFRITEFKETFTGGKNAFLIEGSPFLKETTEVKIEILDVEGNPVYYEPGDGIPEYYEGLSKVVSVHVYPDTPIGLGKITILGEAKQYIDSNGILRDIPDDWKDAYNVKWERTFQLNRNLQNETIVRFYKRPTVNITEIVKPIFNKTIPTKTVSGSVSGEAIQPVLGTNLTSWTAGTVYRLTLSSGSWDTDIDENQINITVNSTSYSPTIIEVLNDKQVLVDVPYTENNIVQSFSSQSFTSSYEDFENEIPGESSLTGSFAKIDLNQLKTFAGDVARVKIFRKSRNQVNDFQLVQESKLESTELLRDIYVSDAIEIPYGNFSTNVLNNYWVTSSSDHPTTVDSSVLSQAVKVDYNGSNSQILYTTESFSISKDVEYELSFRTLLSGSATSNKTLRAFFTGSYLNTNDQLTQFEQNFVLISGSGIFNTRQNVSQNILAERDVTASLAFEFIGDDWYISNVSLRNAQETSFSPDEFTLIQDIPRKLEKETFDFRFEFYDINNNYIPVDVTATKEFDGGNDYVVGGTSARILTFESDRNAFRYASGSASPSQQTILLQHTKTNLTGSITYTSGAFDLGGNFLTSSGWEQYPGLLTNRTNSPSGGSATLTVANFSGSWTGSGTQPEVYSIIYTASVEDLQEFETVFRVEDGDNAPQLLVTSNANQFIYEPTTLSPKPSGQSITIRAQRKNLESLNSTITVTSGSNLPELTVVSDTGGIKTYSISALEFSSSFAANNFDEVTYNFSSPDVFGVNQTDQITLSKVINFDGVSIVLSTENTSFNANSIGTVTSTEFDKGDGSVDVRVGSKTISHSEGLGSKNTFDIISVTPSSGLTANSTTPTTNSYGISAMTVDSGTLNLLIRYKAGDDSTTVDFSKVVNYSKTKIAAPVLSIETTNKDQSVSAFSTGQQIDSFSNSTVTVKEQYGGSTTTKTITSLTAVPNNVGFGIISTTPATGTISLSSNTIPDGINTTLVAVTATVTDSEGTSRTLTDTIALSKVKNATPTILTKISPSTQTINSSSLGYEVPQPMTVIVQEGGDEYTYSGTLATPNTFRITNIGVTAGSASNVNEIITLNTGSGVFTGLEGSASIDYKNSEGTPVTGKLVRFDLSVSKVGVDGQPGIAGPGLTYVGDCDSLASSWVWVSNDDSRHVTSKDISGTRRYYLLKEAADGLTKATTGCPSTYPEDSTYFLSMDSFASVATDFLLAKDATITRALTIGTFGTDEGVIRSANATDFTTGLGLWLDNTGDVRFGDPAGSYVSWDQSAETLTISGDLNFSNGDTISQDGTFSLGGGDITYNGTVLSLSTDLDLNSTTPSDGAFSGGGIYLSKDGWISAENFYISSTGVTAVKGEITATSGYIGTEAAGFVINSSYFANGKSSFGDGNAGVYIGTDGISLGVGNAFSVDSDGVLNASDVNISGGGININNNFIVNSDGSFTATNGVLTGEIYASLGTIGGFTIGGSSISATNITISSGQASITMPNLSISAGSSFTTPTAGTITTSTPGSSTASDSYTVGPLSGNTSVTVSDTGGTAGGNFTAIFNGAAFAGQPAAMDFTLTPQAIGYYGLGNATATNLTANSATINITVNCTLYTPSGNITKTFNVSSSSSNFNNLSVGGTLSGTFEFTLESGTYYIATSIDASSYYNATGNITSYPFSITGQAVFRPPNVSVGNVGVVDNFTEINAGGIQVYSSNTKYVRMPRSAAALYQVDVSGSIKVSDTIYSNGNIIAYYSSDERLKDNLTPISEPLYKLNKLGGYEFDWNDNQDLFEGHDVGVVAQEVQEVFPYLVRTQSNGYLGVKYEKLAPILIESIKELSKKVEELENKLKDK